MLKNIDGKGARRSLAVLRPRTSPHSHCVLESVRQPAKANCTMPQPTAYADALGHYLYLPALHCRKQDVPLGWYLAWRAQTVEVQTLQQDKASTYRG